MVEIRAMVISVNFICSENLMFSVLGRQSSNYGTRMCKVIEELFDVTLVKMKGKV